jgi:Putative transcriptional regulator
MIRMENHDDQRKRGCLDGHFLVAMPGMADERFARTVVFICAHSEDGAMGFVLNRPQGMDFDELISKLGIEAREAALEMHRPDVEPRVGTTDVPVLAGGPVETGRGFVLHSDDYVCQSTIPVSDDLCLTATVDILRAIREGHGPEKGIMLLGYAGWAPGQLESEMAANVWLSCPASDDLVFDRDYSDKYDRVLAMMGVSPAMLSMQSGHA